MEIDTAKPNNPTPPSENVAGFQLTLIKYNTNNMDIQPLFKTGNLNRRVKQICPYEDWLPIGHATFAMMLGTVHFHAHEQDR